MSDVAGEQAATPVDRFSDAEYARRHAACVVSASQVRAGRC